MASNYNTRPLPPEVIIDGGRAWLARPRQAVADLFRSERVTSEDAVSDQHDRILILDFGSQVTQLIARRVREAHVYCEIHPNDVSDQFIRDFKPRGIILSGSHASTYEDRDLRAPQAVWDAGVPVLGICYGMFTMAVQLGGEVEPSTHREFGYAEVRAHGHSRLLNGIEDFSTRKATAC